MRSYGAAALVVLAILAECFGARERSRQRSGPIRSVPVAANVKREVDFDCPEEFGYYPHPTDCTLYYVCVFGGALLESCTGGLMYSHELQTCDWPRNVGCDATGTVVSEQRFSERDRDLLPSPQPPRRTPPPPPPRAKPNPVITSRGQPKFNRQEYEKQQQLYAEVDDLPPVEELENDRQQRVYRGQPSTIGQVQKDRDGYGTQVISSGRTLNSNIIPASIPQNSGKFGSYSFGTQTDDRRTASITPAPQTYRTDNYVTDSSKDSDIDIKTNEIIHNNISKIRIKRDLEVTQNNLTASDKISDKNDSDEIIEYIDFSTGTSLDDNDDVETDRDKRQVRYLLRNGYKSGKNLQYTKPVKITDLQQYNLRSRDLHNSRHQSVYQDQLLNTANRKPFSLENTYFSTANPFMSYQTETMQSQKPFKPSLPDPFNQKNLNNNLYTATQIITKSPPISSLKNEVNQFSSLYGGFYNNAPNEHNMRHNQFSPNTHSSFSKPPVSLHDSSQVPSSIVTNRPISLSSLNHPENDYNLNHIPTKSHPRITKDRLQEMNEKHKQNLNQDNLSETQDYDDSYESDENNESSDEYSDQNFKHVFPDPPYAFTHPSNKYADIENPFARPDFDFDAYLTKLQNDHYSALGITSKPNTSSHKNLKIPIEITTASYKNSVKQTTPLYYQSISTPRPFTISNILTSTSSSMQNNLLSNIKKIQQFTTNPKLTNQSQRAPQSGMYYNGGSKQNIESNIHKLKPPNFTDERQLPITYSFSRPIGTTSNPYFNVSKYSSNFSVNQKPYMVITSTGVPFAISALNQKPKNFVNLNTHSVSSIKPYTFSTLQSTRAYEEFLKQSTPKSVTTISDEQLSTLQNYWNNLNNAKSITHQSTFRPSDVSIKPHFEKLYTPTIQQSTQSPLQSFKSYSSTPQSFITGTTKSPRNRKPIPKPSPEMNDYYYDDDEDEHYNYEPVVKPKYMPSTEVKPQRPPMAQNYKEYEDIYEDSDEHSSNIKQAEVVSNRPIKYISHIAESVPKNQNDVPAVTKAPFKETNKNLLSKDEPGYEGIDNNNLIKRPNVSNYEINHLFTNNKETYTRKPIYNENSLYITKPSKYLNQTTLRPYTVRHRLAKPAMGVGKESKIKESKQNRGRARHPNIVAQMLSTPRDNYNQETRYTKAQHDGKSNSLEPTESVSPSSFSPSPRPKMLYNGSQNYSPDQFDPFYAIYDEDGELYKDTDYVQQYNTASLRPAVQQTYRGTPPPSRRPVETYTPRPVLADDYDDALIQGQINNQNQYQSPVRHSTRGEGNDLGYEHNPSSVRTTVYEATTLSTTPSTTSTSTTTTTTTQRSTTALFTEAMTQSRFTSRPSSTRGRGSAHYSTSSGSEAPQQPQQTNRGTPPTRSRPTLKPSTAIVSETKFVDIYAHPPRRPAPVYPQPTPDKTAAKCRKDVCLLPDCFCGGKDIPGDLPVETVPQIVLLTFDDSVNDLNKVLYSDLFEKGRVNPNGCPITATFYVSHEWTDYSQVQNLYAAGHEMASHTISHSFGEQFSQKKWNREVGGQREILAAYGGVKLEDVRGMRAPFLSVGGNKMFKMLYDSNFTYDSSLPVYENRPPSWPYTFDYKLFHDCMIPPCPTKSYPGVWEVPMVMWQDLNGGRCSMGDACANPPESEGVYKMLLKNFDRHYTTNRAPFGLFYHAAWFTQPHHKEGFIMFLDYINKMKDVWIVTNWQALQWVRDPTPISRLNNFQPFQCNYQDRPKKCNNPKVCNLWHKSGVRYMRTCQPCPEIYPWTGKTGIKSSRIDNDIED